MRILDGNTLRKLADRNTTLFTSAGDAISPTTLINANTLTKAAKSINPEPVKKEVSPPVSPVNDDITLLLKQSEQHTSKIIEILAEVVKPKAKKVYHHTIGRDAKGVINYVESKEM